MEIIGGVLLVVERLEEQVVQFVQEKIDTYFLIRKDCSQKRLQSFFSNINCIEFSDKRKNDVISPKKFFCSAHETGKRSEG